jgi:hypothetical protein
VTSWPVEWAGYEFQPVPRSWIEAPSAVDRKQHAGPQLLAVSAAPKNDGRELLVRYAHPSNGKILVEWNPAAEGDDGSIPGGLVESTWARSIRPGPNDPVDDITLVEERHLEELWGPLIGEQSDQQAVTDGGDRVAE